VAAPQRAGIVARRGDSRYERNAPRRFLSSAGARQKSGGDARSRATRTSRLLVEDYFFAGAGGVAGRTPTASASL
jgi:hypothetical protein